jgi:4-amino-4-deoxy-L-arabinose transferase-like glycosyltransferase
MTEKGRRAVRLLPAAFWLVAAVPYLGFLLATLPAVPFHPDESTYIYMSFDLDRILADGPLSVCWRASSAGDPLQAERERDCPLARYAIAIGRRTGGRPALAAKWDWSATWTENQIRGALPSDALLLAARIPQAILLFLAVLLMARIGWRLGRGTGAVSAALLFGLNSQVLLHARRAMAESALLFGMILVAAVVLEFRGARAARQRTAAAPLSAGAALAVAALAKYSGLLMAPVALAGMFLVPQAEREGLPEGPRRRFLTGLLRGGVMVLAFGAVFLALNPVFWCDPAGAAAGAVSERNRLLGEQVAALKIAAPGSVLAAPGLRMLAVPYELFIAPPAFWDIPNYAAQTAAAERAYLSLPIHALTAGGILAALFAVLSLAGAALAIVRAVRKKDPDVLLLLVWGASVLGGIWIGVPILWQRYYLPLIPVCCLFAALALGEIRDRMNGILPELAKRNPGNPA